MRFNSPPNWPAPPPGWTPPAGWQPDPSWPPPPPGWQLWTADAPAGNKKGLIIGGIAAALVVLIGVVVAVVAFSKNDDVTITKPATTTSAKKDSDEQQIKDVVEKFQNAWNDSDFDAFKPIVCKEAQEDGQFNETDFLDSREGSSKLDLEVTDVQIDGDDATATVENEGTDPDDITMLREDGDWKWCDF